MKEEVKFTDYLEDIEFKKWAVVISNLVWKKSFREIGEHLNCTYQWAHKIVQKFISEGKMIDRREYNGGIYLFYYYLIIFEEILIDTIVFQKELHSNLVIQVQSESLTPPIHQIHNKFSFQ
ncbi:hypothetical protein ABPG72_020072 [Tetrahymena utriculariae]